MDIVVSSNFERLLWYLAYEDVREEADDEKKRAEASKVVDGWMKGLKADGKVEMPVKVLESARRDFIAERISDSETLESIKETFAGEQHYVADPHTAVALGAARVVARSNSPNSVQVVLSTAHPAKFSEAVSRALEGSSQFNFERDILPNEFRGLLEKEKRVIEVERADPELVKNVIEKTVGHQSKAAGNASV